MGDGRYRSELDYERSESSHLDQSRPGSRYSSRDSYGERGPPLPLGTTSKKRPATDEYFENRSPSLKKKAGWNVWEAPTITDPVKGAVKEREVPVVRSNEREEPYRPRESRQPNGDGKQVNYEGRRYSLNEPSVTSARGSSPPVHPDRRRFLLQDPEMSETEDTPGAFNVAPRYANGQGALDHQSQDRMQIDSSMRDNGQHFPTNVEDAPRRSFSNKRSNIANEIMDPRLLPRKDSFTHSASTGNATPQSAYMDTSISSPGNSRSGEQTPIVRPYAGFAIPPPPPPPGSHARSSSKESSSRDMAHVIQSLLQFGQSCAKEASLTMQHDAAVAKLEKKKIEHDRWRPHHDSFKSLAEEQEKEMEKGQVAADRLAERCRGHEEARTKTTQNLAAKLLAINSGSSVSGSENESKMNQLEKEMSEISVEINGMHRVLKALNLEEGQLKAIVSTQHQLSSQMNDLKASTASRQSYRDLESKVSDLMLESKAQDTSERYIGLSDQVNKMETKLNSLVTLTGEVNEHKETLRDLSEEFKTFKKEITGSGQDNPGLIDLFSGEHKTLAQRLGDIIAGIQEEVDEISKTNTDNNARIISLESNSDQGVIKEGKEIVRLQETITWFNGKLDEVIKNNTGHNTRLESLEFTFGKGVKEEEKSALPLDTIGEAGAIPKTNAELTLILKRLEHDQEQKDEIFSEEFEKLNAAIANTKEKIESMRKQYDSVMDKVDSGSEKFNEFLSAQHSYKVSAQRHLNNSQSGLIPPLTSQTQANSLQVQRGSTEEGSQLVLANYNNLFQQLFNRVMSCESAIGGVQRRLNELISDKLASNMIYRMQETISNAQIQIQTLMDLSRKFTWDIGQLSTRIDNLSNQVTWVNSRSLENQKSEMLSKKEQQDNEEAALKILKDDFTDMALESKKKIEAFENRIGLLISKSDIHMDTYDSLNTTFDTVKTEVKEAVEGLKSEMKTIQVRLTEYEETTLREISKLNAKVEVIAEQTGVDGPSDEEVPTNTSVVADVAMLRTPPLPDLAEDARVGPTQPERVEIQQTLFKKPKRPKEGAPTLGAAKARREG